MTRSVSRKAASGVPTGSDAGSGTVGSKDDDGVVGEHAHGSTTKRGMSGSGATRRRGMKRRSASRGSGSGLDLGDRSSPGRSKPTGLDAHGGLAVAHLEQAARQGAQEGVAAEALAALDRLEQVGGRAVVEREEGADRRLEVGVARGAQQDRVVVGGQALGLGQ